VTELGIAAWVLVVAGLLAVAWGIVNRRSRRRVMAAAAVVSIVAIGLVIVMFAGMGAFCVPPPGAACL
jgi:hypothetical protein